MKTLLKLTAQTKSMEQAKTATYKKAEQHFDGNQIAQIIMAVVTINAWNRIAISTKKNQ